MSSPLGSNMYIHISVQHQGRSMFIIHPTARFTRSDQPLGSSSFSFHLTWRFTLLVQASAEFHVYNPSDWKIYCGSPSVGINGNFSWTVSQICQFQNPQLNHPSSKIEVTFLFLMEIIHIFINFIHINWLATCPRYIVLVFHPGGSSVFSYVFLRSSYKGLRLKVWIVEFL